MFRKLLAIVFVASATAQYPPQYQQQYLQQYQYQQQQQQQQPQAQPQHYQQAEQHQPSAAQYPAGVDASSCPNYPDCANPLVTLQAVAKASDPRYLVDNAPSAPPRPKSEYSPEVQQKLDRGEYIGDGDYHGEGLDEAQAPQVAIRAQYAGSPAQYQVQAKPQYQEAAQPQYQQVAQPQYHQVAQPQYQQIAQPQYQAQRVVAQYQQPQQTQRAASQYARAPTAGAVQYPAQQAASQYVSTPQYITAPQGQHYQSRAVPAVQYYQPKGAASEPVAAVQFPAGVDSGLCPNYPFCQ